jgi:type IX secretion system substrate protein
MKKFYTILHVLLVFCFMASGQSFDWIRHNAVGYNLNPELPRHTSCISASGKIYAGRMAASMQIFGIDVFGTCSIDCYNTTGQLQWSFALGQKVVISKMTADVNGNVYVAGNYMETLYLNGTDSLLNTGSAFDVNVFILSLDPSGTILWKRNLSLLSTTTRVEAVAIDNQNNFWYGIMDVFNINIFRTDNNGQDMQLISLQNARTLGGFCFDANSNLFASGSAQMGNMAIGMFTVNVPETYMMFVAYIQNNGTGSWVELAHDVTFQSPVVIPDGAGGAYVGGSLMDSTSFGNVTFDGPQWVYDIFLTHVNTSGSFSWGVEVPIVPSITGDFQPGTNDFLTADAAGNVYITGICRGTINWGNGVITGLSSIPNPSRTLSVICFDANGNPLWNLDGGMSDFDMAYSLHAMPGGDCYFSAAVIDTAVFGSTVFNQNSGIAYVIGKITATPTFVPSLISEHTISVYPVPTHEKLFVSGTFHNINLVTGTQSSVSIYNAAGKKVLSKNLHTNRELFNMELDISSLSPGIYFLEFPGASSGHISFVIE